MTESELSPAAAPIIVTALFGARDFAEFDGLRRRWFPLERNVLRAHMTLFHHLPPSACGEIVGLLRDEARGCRPEARLSGIMNLGGGVAFRIESVELAEVRARIADRFKVVLMPQDRAGWRGHVTIQNKVPPREARALLAELTAGFRPRAVELAGLAAWYYRGGPWEPIAAFGFGSGRRIEAPN